VFSVLVGIVGGASIGREGPTVQLAASTFACIGAQLKKILPEVDFQSYLTAGAAAGIAAAFNTPIAGITFALEEISEGMFGPFREMTILAVVIAGISAQAVLGNYFYFGRPFTATDATPGVLLLLFVALVLGLIGGLFGGLFSRALAFPNPLRLPGAWWLKALVCGLVCSAIGLWTASDTSGSGYEITRKFFEIRNDPSSLAEWNSGFPVLKFITTILSYLSGMAGGIFSPCLSIGAGLGFTFAKVFHCQYFKQCGLIGMTAFFSGAVQAPLTAVVIVMEMTDQHELVLALLVSAFIARAVGSILMPVPLYRFLAQPHH
jgi:H+/Cl- antiporter ClcA